MNKPGIGKIIYTEEEIQQKIAELAQVINRDYKGEKLIVIAVLKGSFYFVADLTRHLTMPLNIDFISIGSTPEELNMTGVIRFTRNVGLNLSGQHVLLVEDVIGTGLTLGFICQHLETFGPASLKICTLLDNPAGRILTLPIDYSCFTMPDLFLVGYGLDYNEEYRNLRYIAEYRE
ncbi:MAG: hypoxanthine phosphoribosyltransferase [Syntrophomonadaceae bacterium]|nr:hypoxanthine phosphoribosyltransferase [Syntrophomonadaceae bacterium]